MADTKLEFLYVPQARTQQQGRHSDVTCVDLQTIYMNQDRNNFRPMTLIGVTTTLGNRFSGQAVPYHVQALSQKVFSMKLHTGEIWQYQLERVGVRRSISGPGTRSLIDTYWYRVIVVEWTTDNTPFRWSQILSFD